MKVTDVPAQIILLEATRFTEGIKAALTDIVTFEDTVGVVAQGEFDVNSTLITSLFARSFRVNVALVAPVISMAFLNHLYDGAVPLFVGVAVKTTDVPAQIVVLDAIKFTVGVKAVLTVIVIFEDAVVVAAQGEFEVNSTLIL